MSAPMLSLDFETRSREDLKRAGVHRYANDPSTDALCASFSSERTGPIERWRRGMPVPGAITAIAERGGHIRAWNAAFERSIWNAIMVPRYGWPTIPDDRWICTASLAARCALPRKLEEAAEAMGLTVRKDAEGYRLMLRMCKPLRDGSWLEDEASMRRLMEYCDQDVVVEQALYGILPDVGSALERRIWLLDQTINDRGVLLDAEFVSASQAIVEAEEKVLNARMREVTRGAVTKVTQTARLVKWLGDQGVKTDSVDKEHMRDLLGTELAPVVREALEIRALGAKASTAKLRQMAASWGEDHRVRDMLLYHGASTGRWSGKGVQPQNFPRPFKGVERYYDIIREGDRDLLDMTAKEPVMEVMSSALRGCFLAAPGEEFTAADFNAIEARVLAWLAGAGKLLHAFAQPKNLVYAEMGADIFGKTPEEVEAADKDGSNPLWRFVGKNTVLGCGYQMGAKTFRKQVKKQTGIDLPDEVCELAVATYRGVHWEVPELWKDMSATALRVVKFHIRNWAPVEFTEGRIAMRMDGEWLRMRLPSGRSLWYCRPQITEREAPWSTAEDPAYVEGVDIECVHPITKKWGRRHLYGGLLTENAVQAISRDLLAEAMLRLEARGYPVVLTVHDEILTEHPVRHGSVEEFCNIMSELPAWASGCPVAAAGWRGERWRK